MKTALLKFHDSCKHSTLRAMVRCADGERASRIATIYGMTGPEWRTAMHTVLNRKRNYALNIIRAYENGLHANRKLYDWADRMIDRLNMRELKASELRHAWRRMNRIMAA